MSGSKIGVDIRNSSKHTDECGEGDRWQERESEGVGGRER